MNIVFDIETIPCQTLGLIEAMENEKASELADALSAVKAPANYKDAAKIAEFCENQRATLIAEHSAKVMDCYLRTSFDGGLGQVCVIGFAIEDNVPMAYSVGADLSPAAERKLLEDFFCLLTDAYRPTNRPVLIGHNSNAFDIPFLWKRAIVLGVQPPLWFPRDPKPWGESTFDTMTAWAGMKERVKMNQLCRILGIPDKGDMDGSKVWPAVQAGRIADVAVYCKGDVERTRAIYRRMTFA